VKPTYKIAATGETVTKFVQFIMNLQTKNLEVLMNKFAIACISLCSVILTGAATAAPAITFAPANQSLVEQTHWHHGWGGPRIGIYVGPGIGVGYGYGSCRGVRYMCAERWGWGGPGFGRCLWRHGC
jgi:hypothetical protein